MYYAPNRSNVMLQFSSATLPWRCQVSVSAWRAAFIRSLLCGPRVQNMFRTNVRNRCQFGGFFWTKNKVRRKIFPPIPGARNTPTRRVSSATPRQPHWSISPSVNSDPFKRPRSSYLPYRHQRKDRPLDQTSPDTSQERQALLHPCCNQRPCAYDDAHSHVTISIVLRRHNGSMGYQHVCASGQLQYSGTPSQPVPSVFRRRRKSHQDRIRNLELLVHNKGVCGEYNERQGDYVASSSLEYSRTSVVKDAIVCDCAESSAKPGK